MADTDKKTGFAGLDDLTSDIDDLDDIYNQGLGKKQDNNGKTKSSNSTEGTSKTYNSSNTRTTTSYQNNGQRTTGATHYYSHQQSTGSTYSQPKEPFWRNSAFVILSICVVLIILFSYMSSDNKQQFTNSSDANYSSNASSSNSSSNTSENVVYTKPSFGTGQTFSTAELRWILREEIRIETMRPRLRSNYAVHEFNYLVDNYNSCAKGQYYDNSMSVAKQDVENDRSSIVNEAITRVEYWNTK